MLNCRNCRKKLTDYIVDELVRHKIDVVFGYTGGSIADLIDSIYQSTDIRFLQNLNEQASAFCANAYAQISGKTGVAIASSGPGAINLINGIANAYFDSIPCVFITGNVHSLSKKSSNEIRQNAFQETNIVDIVTPITKYCVQIENAEDIKYQLQKAFFIANDGRKGPVLIDIPYDIQRTLISVSNESEKNQFQESIYPDLDFSNLNNLLAKSKRPLLLVGGGCLEAREEVRSLLKILQIPVVSSLRGIDIISHRDINYVGFIGSYGNRYANLAVYHCDLLIVLGSRLDERQIGYKRNQFAPFAHIVQVDIDKTELGQKTDNIISILSPIKRFVIEFSKQFTPLSPNLYNAWKNVIREWKRKYSSEGNFSSDHNANCFFQHLSDIMQDDAVIIADVGQNQMISAQSLNLHKDNRYLQSAGLACMGYSLPASIGAYYANPEKQIISINGDGGIQMNLQELQTISRERIPIKIFVLNNSCLGLIRKLQENLFEKRYFASVDGFSAPNFKKIADAFGFLYFRVESHKDYSVLLNALSSSHTVLIEIVLPIEMHANPEPGKEIYMQEPPLSDNELKNIQQQIEALS